MALNKNQIKSLFNEANESADSFGQSLPPGKYVMKATEFMYKKCKAPSTSTMIAQTYEVIDGDMKGRKHWENSVLENKIGLSILFQRLRKMGYDTNIGSIEDLMEIVDDVNKGKPTLLVNLVQKGSGVTAKLYFNIEAIVTESETEDESDSSAEVVEAEAEVEDEIPNEPEQENVSEESEESEEDEVELAIGMVIKFNWKDGKVFRGAVTKIDTDKNELTVKTPKGNTYSIEPSAIIEVIS